VAAAALARLARDGQIDASVAANAIRELGIDPEKKDPARS
jgi:pyruvate dehydrogenase complex dehydrogenase (E1) component